jgi:hypothetical protein
MSLIPDIQDALADLIGDATTVPVDVGYPGFVQPEHIWVKGTSSVTWENESTGYCRHDESGDVEVLCLVARANSEYTVPRDRAFTIADIVTTAVASDRTLGGTVDRAWVAGVESVEAMTDGERQVGVTVRVSFARAVAG